MAIDLEELYRDLHEHPELSFREHRKAAIVAGHLLGLGLAVHEGIGGTGVVGVLENGPGPTVLLRADMDGLPVQEETGLPYASRVRATGPDGNDVPVMHACGHDVHVTALLGAVEVLAGDRNAWSGTLVAVFQPAEERGGGAQAMVEDGLFQRVPVPDVVLGQHVAPFPVGWVGLHAGVAMASPDALTVTLHGVGGHGSRPETTIDPVTMAAATTLRLNSIVSRELAATSPAVLTVGQLHAGTKHNVIPERATLGISVRSFDESVRSTVLAAIGRVVRGEAAASGAVREPDIVQEDHFPVTVNDADATERTRVALRGAFGGQHVIDPGHISGSEDVGNLATAAGAPLVFWFLGGADPQLFAGASNPMAVAAALPSNHSPRFAPVIQPTLTHGVDALVAAAREWLA
ncbi:amidohydrolase [Arthrobacter sp. JSM 101049]|uniref:amidohydrolase n=1 Tax=Arthrobacter sp. JSM 101049 TaxID=929097 RepID=UPI003562B7AC